MQWSGLCFRKRKQQAIFLFMNYGLGINPIVIMYALIYTP